MESLGIIGYGAITAIAFFVGYCIKQTPIKDCYIPVFTLATGAAMGILCFFGNVPDFAPNIVEAIARGIVSGAAATGIHQVWKQFSTDDGEDDTQG